MTVLEFTARAIHIIQFEAIAFWDSQSASLLCPHQAKNISASF